VALIFMFPGQSSADPGMVGRALSLHRSAQEVLDRAHAALGEDAIRPYAGASGARLRSNRDVQIAVFLTTQMHLAALRAEGLEAPLSAGLSLGEYSHLVHIGALTFEDALALVARRGTLYDDSPPGAMVAVLGATRAQVEAARVRFGGDGALFVSNYNTPTQHVIAGQRTAVERAAAWLEDEYAAHTVETESRVPMHTPLLNEVAARFRPHLESAPWRRPRAPYVPNVTAVPLADPGPDDFVEHLTRHVTSAVRWRATIEAITARDADAVFVEVGPGAVLHNMLARRWLTVRRASTDDHEGTEAGTRFRSTLEELRA